MSYLYGEVRLQHARDHLTNTIVGLRGTVKADLETDHPHLQEHIDLLREVEKIAARLNAALAAYRATHWAVDTTPPSCSCAHNCLIHGPDFLAKDVTNAVCSGGPACPERRECLLSGHPLDQLEQEW